MQVAQVVECLMSGAVGRFPRVTVEEFDAWPVILDIRAADPGVTCLVQDDIEHPADHAFMFGPLGARQDFRRWWVDLCSMHRAMVELRASGCTGFPRAGVEPVRECR